MRTMRVTVKLNVRVSVENQARVFNVEVHKVEFFPVGTSIFQKVKVAEDARNKLTKLVTSVACNNAPKYCTVVVNKGFKRHRGEAIGIFGLMSKLQSLKFYHYVEKEKEVTEYVPLSTFYEKPFRCEYEDHIGATFFHAINEKIIYDPVRAINDATRGIPSPVFLAKSGNYYVWDHLTMQIVNVSKFVDAPQHRYQLCKVVTKTVKSKVKEEYK